MSEHPLPPNPAESDSANESSQSQEPENQETENQNPVLLARSAATTALPFAEQLAKRFTALAEAIRNGDDNAALEDLGASTEELEHFLTFLVLVSEILESSSPEVQTTLVSYRNRLISVLEDMQPSLGAMDLVEVADTLEHDVVGSLCEYRDYNQSVQEALLAA